MGKQTPLISIIVPIYKAEQYLEKCLQSIVNQTYTNLEIILVNDGSPDRCGEICEELGKSDPRIKIINKENGGAATARNAGLDAVTGKYIAFADSDDYMESNYLETLYHILEGKNAQVAICGFETVDEEGKKMALDALHDRETAKDQGIEIWSGSEIILQELQGHWEHVAPWGKLFKAELYHKIRYPKWPVHEDEPVFIEVFEQVQRVAVTADKLYYYVQHEGSLMNTAYSEKDRRTYLTMWRERLEYFHDGQPVHRQLCIQVEQAYVAWNVLYLSLHSERMTSEQQKELKRELRKNFRSLFKKPFLFDLRYSCKMAVKSILTLINPNLLRKRYVE
jgi:glycosyltransferase involved in cell wall biosynthesis